MAIAEAAVGVILGELARAVLEIRGSIAAYNSTFETIHSTLQEIIPIVEGIDDLNRKLDNTGPSTKTLWTNIKRGKQLIEECKAEMNGCCSCFNKPQNLERLRELDNSLKSFCQVVVPLQHLRQEMETQHRMDRHFKRVNDRLGNIEERLGHLNTPEQQQGASSAVSTQTQPTSSIPPARPSMQTQPTSSIPPARPSTQAQPTSSVLPARPSTQKQPTSSVPPRTPFTQTQPTSSIPPTRPSTQTQPTSSVPSTRPSMQTEHTLPVPPARPSTQMQPTSSIPLARPSTQMQPTSSVPPETPSTQTQPTSFVHPARPSTQTQPTHERIKMGVTAASQVLPLSNPSRPSEPPQERENIDNRTRPDQSRTFSTRVEDAATCQPSMPPQTPELVKEIVKPKVPDQPYPSRTVNLPAKSATSSQQPSASSGPLNAKETPETIKYTSREPVSSNLSDGDDKGVQKDNKVGKTLKEDNQDYLFREG